jgi:hypothetical protein
MAWRASLSAAMTAADAISFCRAQELQLAPSAQALRPLAGHSTSSHQAAAELSGSECARVRAKEIAMPRRATGGVEDKDNVDDM